MLRQPQADPARQATVSVLVDDDARYVDAPPEALELFGVSLEELRQRRIGDFAPQGLGPIHRALFLWVARQGDDFGGGRSTVVRPDGGSTTVECTAIEPVGDGYRVDLRPVAEPSSGPHTDAIASVLDAWRRAERLMAAGNASDPDYDLARRAADALRDVYQAVAVGKSAATNGDSWDA